MKKMGKKGTNRRIARLSVLFILITSFASFAAAYSSNEEYMLPESNSRYLIADDLYGMTDEDLRIARNEIFARHGMKFGSELSEYFLSKDWYEPKVRKSEFSYSVFNEYELKNIDLIVDVESGKIVPENPPEIMTEEETEPSTEILTIIETTEAETTEAVHEIAEPVSDKNPSGNIKFAWLLYIILGITLIVVLINPAFQIYKKIYNQNHQKQVSTNEDGSSVESVKEIKKRGIYLTSKQYDNQVQKYSVRLKEAKELKEEYLSAVSNVAPYLKYEIDAGSKSRFDHFNYDGCLQTLINDNPEIRNTVYSVKYNRARYNLYTQKACSLPPQVTESEIKDYYFRPKMFIKEENKLVGCESIERINECTVIVNAYYVSPQGVNSYSGIGSYNIDEVEAHIEAMERYKNFQASAAYQRSLMSNSLRYDILKRDGFKCVLCGRSAAEGAKLHVDHIKPVSKGGKTVKSNLRTLCDICNEGKSDKYDENGLN